MAIRKRMIILPITILVVAVVLASILGGMRQAPVQETPVRPAVLVEYIAVEHKDETFRVPGQGNVMPRFETQLVSEVSGRIASVSPRFVTGGFFREGEVMLTLDRADYESELEEARANLARAQAAVAQERALGRVAESEWRSIEAGEIPELGLRQPQLASELANLRSAEARLNRAERNLERTEIRAPFDAVLQARNVNLGQFISMNTPVAMLYGTEIAEIRLPLTDYDLSFLDREAIDSETSAGPAVTLRTEVAGQTREWRGALVRTDGILDPTSRVTFAVVEVQDPYNRQGPTHEVPLNFGRFVRAEINGITVSNLAELPRHAVNADGQVWVIDDERILSARSVTVYRADRQSVYISEGLEEGERVMITQLDNPLPGIRVRLPGDPLLPVEPEEETDDEGANVVQRASESTNSEGN
ncbi:MAG: efflux RND transporter periplasmic adaptor subunit [Idiomarina sp.]|nr:efflux RND transporter periplasmic adaptor subunit [Idiomarina sp.]